MLLNAAAEIAIHVLWFYFMGSSLLTSRDVDTVVPILLVPLIALTEFFLVIRTPVIQPTPTLAKFNSLSLSIYIVKGSD